MTRFAVVAGTKVSKSAVKRNRAKRQVRAILEKHLTDFDLGLDVALLVRPAALKATFVEIEQHVMNGLVKAGIFKKG